MSRRPLENAQRPARGGDGWRYRWSESPIPRSAFRRVRQVGEPSPPEWAPSGWDGLSIKYSDLAVTNCDFGPLTAFLATPVAGMHVVAIAHGVGCSFSAPSGWTQKASVTAGTYLTAKVFHLVLSSASWSGVDLDFTSDATRTGYYDAAQASAVELLYFTPTAKALQVASATDTGVSSHHAAEYGSTWLSPWQSWTLLGAVGAAAFSAFDYDQALSYQWAESGSSPATKQIRYRSNGPILGGGYGPLAPGTHVTEAASNNCDWISFAFGWA